MSLVGPNQNALQVQGYFKAKLEKEYIAVTETVYVVKDLCTPLVGRPAIVKMKLVTQVDSISEDKKETQFPELFNGLGRIKGSYQIELVAGLPHFIESKSQF